MEQKKANKKLIIISAAVLIVMVAVFAVVYSQLQPKAVDGTKNIVVEIIKGDTDKKEITINTDCEYLRAAIDEYDPELLKGTEGDYGLYINTVDGRTADEAIMEWWCITKGGEDVFTGIDTTPIFDGDRFEITLMTGW